jgi:prepilin-type N-terminal cleavage/methylation domain-containing protein
MGNPHLAASEPPAQTGSAFRFPLSTFRFRSGFSLMEVLVVVSILSMIVLALMSVFSSTQRAFRASVTQTDVLEGGRATMELMASDLRGLTPSGYAGQVNMMVLANSVSTPQMHYSPLAQSLPGSTVLRTNLLNFFFILGRQNNAWTGTGYIVDTTSASPLFPLYRYQRATSITNPPSVLFNDFFYMVNNYQWTNMSHLVDGVVHMTVHAYDPHGRWINEWAGGVYQPYTNAFNLAFQYPPAQSIGNGFGEAQFYMYAGTVPASVDLELGVLEDHAIARAESLGIQSPPHPPSAVPAEWNFLQNQINSLHLFHQRVNIPNVDKTAYQ